MKKFVKVVLGDFINESRDQRELDVVREFSPQIIVVAKGEHNSIEKLKDYDIHRRTTRPFGNKDIWAKLGKVVSIFLWASYIRKLKADVISCHDLSALIIGWMSTFCRTQRNKPKLVYDSHEYEMERVESRTRNIVVRKTVAVTEQFLMKKCAFSIMVNESIANEVKEIYCLKNEPIVVRNIPYFWSIDNCVCREKRKSICNLANVSLETTLIMYHGGVVRARGIENIITAIGDIQDILLVIMGNADERYKKELVKHIQSTGNQNKVLFLPAVKQEDLWQYIGAVDIETCLIQNSCRSYYLSLPNKLMESIQGEVPIIASNFPEIEKVVSKYDIGILVSPESIQDLSKAIIRMQNNGYDYIIFKQNINIAKHALCWENERKKLREAYYHI